MPLDTTSPDFQRFRPSQTPCLDRAERQAAACFGPRMRAVLAATPASGLPLMILAQLGAGVAAAHFRVAPHGSAEALPRLDEIVLACLPTGLPASPAERLALTLRLASAAAGAWRQRCQLQRLGLLA